MTKTESLQENETLGLYKVVKYFFYLNAEYVYFLCFPVYNKIVKLLLEQLNLKNQLRVNRKNK